MKHIPFILYLSAIAATTLASDVRTVNQKKIDLQPIHDWKMAKTEGVSYTNAAGTSERPLQHWKDIFITEYVKTLGSLVVVARLGDGTTQTIMLRNCPQSLVTKLTRKKTLIDQLKGASANSRDAAANAVEKEGKASASYSVSGSASYVNAVAADEQRRQDQAATAKARAKRTKEEVEAINDELKKLDKEIDIEGKLLAMSMGNTYAGFPVWDTGITSR